MKIVECKTNHMINPLGFMINKPVFSYKIIESKGKSQTEARICVSYNPNMEDPLYDTGFTTIDSISHTANIMLKPCTRYYWNVCVHSDADEEATSEVNWFETGKMNTTWEAKWITCDSENPRHPIFFKDLDAQNNIKSARLYICGLGLYEAYFNSKKISNEFLTPYCNDYSQWLQYQTYDITNQIKKGGKIEILLGNGWYKGRFGPNSSISNDGNSIDKSWKLIAEIKITYIDGSEKTIGTDKSWNVYRSKITSSNIYDGEAYDATLEDKNQEDVSILDQKLSVLSDRLSTPVTTHKEIKPIKLITTPIDEMVLDLGQNIAGIFKLRVNEPFGTIIKIQFGEILQNGNFYRENLRTAKAEYLYVSNGQESVIQPRFTFYGYRYAKIEGISNLNKDDFSGLVLYSEIPLAGKLTTGNEKVNKLIENTNWSQISNFIDVPTDCPQRDERLGWTGDAQVFSPTAFYLRDCYAFFKKYLYDLNKEQQKRNGMIPAIIPSFDIDKEGTAAWGDAACIIPWNMYLFYGDCTILEDQYSSMKSWIDYITKVNKTDFGWHKKYHHGDWLALDNPPSKLDQLRGFTDPEFIADVYYAYSTSILANTADILEKEDDANYYKKLSDDLFNRIKKEYYTATGRCCINTQTALLLSLKFNLSSNLEYIKDSLRKKFKETGGKLQTGFVGTPILCNQLSENNMSDLAYDIVLNEEYPGWLYSVNLDATTIWERWDSVLPDGSISTSDMNSLNHYANGSVVEWLYKYAAGIKPCIESPGFRQVYFKSNPDGRLKHISAEYNTPAGIYKSSWKILSENQIELNFSVPFGGTAYLILPYAPEDIYTKLENPIFENVSNNICTLSHGEYHIQYEATRILIEQLNSYSKLSDIYKNSEAKALLLNVMPQMANLPSSMLDLSLRQLVERFGQENLSEMLDMLDKKLSSLF